MEGGVIQMTTDAERQELRKWSAKLQGWVLMPCQFGSIPGNLRMYWVSLKDNELCKECREEEWMPDDPNSPVWQIQIVIEALRNKGFTIIITSYGNFTEGDAYEIEVQNSEQSLISIEGKRCSIYC